MADVATTLTTVKAVAERFDEAKELAEWVQKQKWFSRLRDIFREKHNFLFLGPTGVGKTNLIESLRTNVPVDIDRMNRTLDSSTKALKVDNTILRFIDVPGEIGKKDIRLDVIRRQFSGKITGIVNVTTYGYHEHASGNKSDALTREHTAKHQWLRDHRRMEIEATEEWVKEFSHLRSSKGLITIITKADLWWTQRDTVLKYYGDKEGEYYTALGKYSIKVLFPTARSSRDSMMTVLHPGCSTI
jgi:GTPase SAR1 family protein